MKIQTLRNSKISIPSRLKGFSQSPRYQPMWRSFTLMSWIRPPLTIKFSHSRFSPDGSETSRKIRISRLCNRCESSSLLRRTFSFHLSASNHTFKISCSSQNFEFIRQKNEFNLHFKDFPTTLIKLLLGSGTNNSSRYKFIK